MNFYIFGYFTQRSGSKRDRFALYEGANRPF